jgi:anti-sigma regulatory factor (Ser/Thr protein kinase)
VFPVGATACHLELSADIGRLADARRWAADIAARVGFSEDDAYAVRLAVSEGVTNAIVHGSASQRDRIELAARRDEAGLEIEVRDQGTRPPGSPADRIAEGGRGLELVALMMDEMQLTRTDGGSVLRFVKRR